ncbi:DUF916 and DUF3324 domain-containing protein [Carnobacterium maltaromaticum]|uniref:DUF916 and DUF3324 domain-containing protein n=1 Tax=Carnobacterium maltaromaticum TaxID=2751 RepID=UPI00026C8E85|nr:DUF3324 domain-containing protein [Carnobacterium maltaromaticum]
MKKYTKLIIFMVALLTTSTFLITKVNASELNFSVEPIIPANQRDQKKTYFDLKMEAGASQTIEINLRNDTKNDVIIQPRVNSALTNIKGVVEYGELPEKQDSTLIHNLNDIVTVVDEVIVPAESHVRLPLTIDMPKEEFDGILAGGITLQEKQTDTDTNKKGEQGLSIQNRYAYVVALVLNENDNEIVPELELNEIAAAQVNARNVINANLQNITAMYVNQLSVNAKITRQGQNEVLYKSTSEGMQMAPNSNFNYPISLDGAKLEAGKYTLEMTAESKGKTWHWKENFTIDGETANKLNKTDVTIENNSNWIYILIGVSLILVALILWFILWKRKKKKEEEARKKELAARKRKKKKSVKTEKK